MITQQEFIELEGYFKKVEKASIVPLYSNDKNLCVRLDGIKISKKLLKDKLSNAKFNMAFTSAIKKIYYLLRNATNKENKNFFKLAFSISDEVSFILNNKTNYYKNKPLKICTLLAGTLSSAMTIEMGGKANHKNKFSKIIAFDARPLILKNDKHEIDNYIRFRWLQQYRNLMCKVVRLKSPLSEKEIYETDLKDDITELSNTIEKYNLKTHLETALKGSVLFKPDKNRDFQSEQITSLNKLNLELKDIDV
ncbi:MAG: hypothetical protein JRJ49_02775 [Deltaproteobacteria bacterium]|nr:hypothetical protein [Deltaproteobacteria bacterium]